MHLVKVYHGEAQGCMDDHVQAARSQRVHTALGEVTGEEAHVNGVVELMLDITESSVAFCWELGAGKLHAGKTYAQHAPLSYCMYQSRHDCCISHCHPNNYFHCCD